MRAEGSTRRNGSGERWVTALPVLLYLWVALPFLRPDRWVTGFDTVAYSGPNAIVTRAGWREWRVPQWNSEIFGGAAHLANLQAAVFDPLFALATWLPVHRSLLVVVAARIALLGTGTWLLLRRSLAVSLPAAAAGTMALLGSGLVMARSVQYEQIGVVCWLPWVLLGCDLAVRATGRPSRLVVLPLAVALLAVSGHPQQAYITMPFVALWSVGRVLDLRAGWRGARRLLLACVLGAGIAAVQLVPAATALPEASVVADRTLADAADPLLNAKARRLPVTVLGDVTATNHAFTPDSFEAMGFVGAVAAALALVGVAGIWRHRARWTMVAVVASTGLGALLALGPHTAVYRVAHGLVPGFDLARVPARWLLLTAAGLAVLAAIGVDTMREREGRRRGIALLGAVGLPVVVASSAGWFLVEVPERAVIWWLVAFAAVGVATWQPRRAGGSGRWPSWLVVALLAGELAVLSNHSIARSLVEPRPFTDVEDPLVARIADQPGRALSLFGDHLGDPLQLVADLRPNANVIAAVASIDGYDGGTQVTDRWVQAGSALLRRDLDPALTIQVQAPASPSSAVSARLGIRWLLVDTRARSAASLAGGWGSPVATDGARALFENPRWQGEARLVHRSIDAPRDGPAPALRRAQPDEVVLEAGEAALTCDSRCQGTTLRAARPRSGAIDVSLPGGTRAGLVVVAEQVAPGWSARVDGRPVAVEEADGMLIGVRVPADAREVEVRFTAPGLAAGAWLTLGSVVLLVGFVARERRRQRRDADPARASRTARVPRPARRVRGSST